MLLPANILNHIKTDLGMPHDFVSVDNALAGKTGQYPSP